MLWKPSSASILSTSVLLHKAQRSCLSKGCDKLWYSFVCCEAWPACTGLVQNIVQLQHTRLSFLSSLPTHPQAKVCPGWPVCCPFCFELLQCLVAMQRLQWAPNVAAGFSHHLSNGTEEQVPIDSSGLWDFKEPSRCKWWKEEQKPRGSVQVGAGTCASEATQSSSSSGERVCWGMGGWEVWLAVETELKVCSKECAVGMNRTGL